MDAAHKLLMVGTPTIVPVIMAGGSGTRLWPLSREQYPKPFLPLTNDRSLLQNTALRAARIDHAVASILIGAEAHRFLIAEQLRDAGIENATVLLEPEGRNTAPAAAIAAHFVAEEYGPEAILFLMAADHAVGDEAAFIAAVQNAAQVAASGRIVTFGIKPTRPETGYGYIKLGAPLKGKRRRAADPEAYQVEAFIEKPSADRAQAFLRAGGYCWNAGLFMFRADRFLAELERLEPAMSRDAIAALHQGRRSDGFVHLEREAFRACRNESIDYAVMEKTAALAVVPMDAGWDDVGSWTFMAELPATDDAGNRARGDVLLEDAAGNLVHAGSRLVALVGVRNQVVVETPDAVLVTTRERAQDVKKLVGQLKKNKRSEAETHARVYRPWGFYETIALGDRFQVKRIQVKPGQKLSLQMHHHRAEHWVVVRGTARVTCGEQSFLLTEDQSTYIPLGNVHRLENPGKLPLDIIEVQSGAYLGEDDIVRIEDVYGRTAPAPAAPPPGHGCPSPVGADAGAASTGQAREPQRRTTADSRQEANAAGGRNGGRVSAVRKPVSARSAPR